MIYRHNIKYSNTSNGIEVRQIVSSFSHYNLEGNFEKVIEFLNKEKDALYEAYVNKASKIKCAYFLDPTELPPRAWHSYAETFLEVKFDRLEIDFVSNEDGTEFVVWGIRSALPEELEAIKRKDEIDKEHRLAEKKRQFEALKKELGQ